MRKKLPRENYAELAAQLRAADTGETYEEYCERMRKEFPDEKLESFAARMSRKSIEAMEQQIKDDRLET